MNATQRIGTEQSADAQAILDKLTRGIPLDAETYERIRAQAEKATEEMRREQGETEIAVDLIREVRDDQ